MFVEYRVGLKIGSYIAHPYWPEMNEVIEIQKKSGLSTKKTDDTRDAALKAYLSKIEMNQEQYDELVRLSQRPWYRLNGKDLGTIIIPRHQMSGCLVQATQSAPAGAKVKKDALRSILQIGDFLTDKKKCDGVFKRYVRPSQGGTGKPASHQRSLRENEFVENAMASGTVQIDADALKMETVKALLKHAGKFVGVGASRVMGYGRFIVDTFELSV